MGPATRKVLNGIVLGKKLGVTREVRSRIRAGIHRLATGAVPLQDQPKYLRSLIARLRQAETINPSQIQKLRARLKAVLNEKPIALAQRRYFLKQLA
jgi:hypothetical protein